MKGFFFFKICMPPERNLVSSYSVARTLKMGEMKKWCRMFWHSTPSFLNFRLDILASFEFQLKLNANGKQPWTQ